MLEICLNCKVAVQYFFVFCHCYKTGQCFTNNLSWLALLHLFSSQLQFIETGKLYVTNGFLYFTLALHVMLELCEIRIRHHLKSINDKKNC